MPGKMLGPHRSDLTKPLVIRRAGPTDAAAIARVYVDSWRESYEGQLPANYLAKLDYTAFERHWRQTFAARGWAFVAAEGERVVGIASGGRARRQNPAPLLEPGGSPPGPALQASMKLCFHSCNTLPRMSMRIAPAACPDV